MFLVKALEGIIPAYAGSTADEPHWVGTLADHPRIRGEHAWGYPKLCSGTGSSPHTRGAPGPWRPWRRRGWIIPAYAGSTRFRSCCHRRRPDHPRIRGEHKAENASLWASVGSSPHTRGAPASLSLRPGGARIIPAYAGSTSDATSRLPTKPDHPRIRGEHFTIEWEVKPGRGSSPHTRGALEMTLHKNGLVGIIPAYAGSTF